MVSLLSLQRSKRLLKKTNASRRNSPGALCNIQHSCSPTRTLSYKKTIHMMKIQHPCILGIQNNNLHPTCCNIHVLNNKLHLFTLSSSPAVPDMRQGFQL